jgi:3-methyladenine DNA glycosylase AlkD
MSAADLYNTILLFCRANQDPAIVKKYSRYFKGVYNAWGLQTGMVLSKSKEIAKMQGVTLELVLETAPLLLKSGKYEETSFALVLLEEFHRKWTRKTFSSFEKWFDKGIDNWAHTDFIGGEIMPLFFKKGLATMDDLAGWRKAKSRFQRRAVPVSLIKQMKAADRFQPFFDFLEPMMTDPER